MFNLSSRLFSFTRVEHLLKPVILALLSVVLCNACVGVSGIANSLSNSILNQGDPETVRDAVPTYLILLDSLIDDDPDNETILLAGSKLYGAYASTFVTDPKRSRYMASKALDYAKRAFCEELDDYCEIATLPLDQFTTAVQAIDDEDDLPYFYGYASAWATWIQAHANDWSAIADLPKVEVMMRRVIEIDDSFEKGEPHLYMGVLLTQRPASLGGKPELGRQHFEKAIEISLGRNLMAKVFYARSYARLVFDKALHDQLVREVLAADVSEPGLTLINTLAKEQAAELAKTSDDYF